MNRSIFQHKGQTYSLIDLTKGDEIVSLSKTEKVILATRIKYPKPLGASVWDSIGDELMLEASAAHGVMPPASEAFQRVISSQIVEICSTNDILSLSSQELHLAIRINADDTLSIPEGCDAEKSKLNSSFVSSGFVSKCIRNYLSINKFMESKFKNILEGIK